MPRPWATPDAPESLLLDIIKKSEMTIKDIKKERIKVNIISILFYILLVVLVREVKMLNVISTAFLVTAHFNYLTVVRRIISDNEIDISLANVTLDFKKSQEEESENED